MIYVCDEANQCEKRKECCIYDTVHKDEYGEVEMGLCFQKDKFVTFSMLAEEYMLKTKGLAYMTAKAGYTKIQDYEGVKHGSGQDTDKG